MQASATRVTGQCHDASSVDEATLKQFTRRRSILLSLILLQGVKKRRKRTRRESGRTTLITLLKEITRIKLFQSGKKKKRRFDRALVSLFEM